MVTGIFDVDRGAPFWDAADRYRDAGYRVGWAVRMARRHGDPTSRRRVFMVAVLPECLADGFSEADFFTAEGTSLSEVTVASCLDRDPEPGLEIPADDVQILPERDSEGFDGPRLVGTIGIGGMGWSVYDCKGPAVTQKTWGQGPGGATAIYRDAQGRFRRLSPWEAMRTHSFPESFIAYLRDEAAIDWELAYRLCGNSIPVGMLHDVVANLVTMIKPQVLRKISTATARLCATRTTAPAQADTRINT
jgi:site-specific DNA-cytosine methylase